MQVVIDINDNEYMAIKEYPNNITSYPITIHIYDAIRNGIPLQKGHGRLIDADKIEYFESSFLPHIYSDIVVRKEFIDAMPTILKADTEVDNTRDCENCKHYKKNEGIYGCETWECSFERKDDGGAETL